MFTTVAFSESIDCAGAYANIAGVPDQHIKVTGDDVTVPSEYNYLVGGMACIGATSPVGARFIAPSLRRTNPNLIIPFINDIHPAASVCHTVRAGKGVQLDPNESLSVEVNSNPAAAEQVGVIAFLARNILKPVEGKIITIQASWTGALTAGTWVAGNITLADDLPTGKYKVVGLAPVIDTAVLARFIPLGSTNRPGSPCLQLGNINDNETFRFGNLGEWFTFETIQLPQLEVIGSGAVGSATYQIFIDVIPV